jgi:hypothetical protein
MSVIPGWLSVVRKKRHTQQDNDTPFVDIRNKLLVVQSEYMFANRESFMYDVLLPFLHPRSLPLSSSSKYVNNSTLFNFGNKKKSINRNNNLSHHLNAHTSLIVDRGRDASTKQKIQNQKKTKHPSAQLSRETARRLLDFYATIPLEKILWGLQESGRAVIVPALANTQDHWW